jgi:hypothetical protein
MDRPAVPLRRWQGLAPQLGTAVLLGIVAWWLAEPDGTWLGLSGRAWLLAALVVPTVHQVVVAVGWRLELFDRRVTGWFGGRALTAFGAVFLPLFALRPLVVLGTGFADVGSLWRPGPLAGLAAAVLAAPALWTFASVARYFGLRRALGADHFEPDFDAPLVRRGAFAVVPNAMYVLGFLALWAIAVATGSRAALVAAGFQHALIWAHYLWTERPDMEVIYGGRPLAH